MILSPMSLDYLQRVSHHWVVQVVEFDYNFTNHRNWNTSFNAGLNVTGDLQSLVISLLEVTILLVSMLLVWNIFHW